MELTIKSKKYGIYSVLIDDEDFNKVKNYKWHISKRSYNDYVYCQIVKNNKKTSMSMHRFLMNAEKNINVDHINCNGLDNRKCNLRKCNQKENLRNSRKTAKAMSIYKGVTLHKPTGLWNAKIKIETKRISLKYHKTEEAAARAYNEAAIEYFGGFARLNIIQEETI